MRLVSQIRALMFEWHPRWNAGLGHGGAITCARGVYATCALDVTCALGINHLCTYLLAGSWVGWGLLHMQLL